MGICLKGGRGVVMVHDSEGDRVAATTATLNGDGPEIRHYRTRCYTRQSHLAESAGWGMMVWQNGARGNARLVLEPICGVAASKRNADAMLRKTWT